MRVEDIINCIPHPTALLDDRLCVSAMNSELEAVVGLSGKDARGIRVDHVIRFDIGLDIIEAALKEERPLAKEGDIIDSRRKRAPFRFTFSPLKDRDERADTVLVVMEDISFLLELDKRAKGGERAKSILGHSRGIQEIQELIPVWAHTDATLLVTGETGTGKDLLAEAVHLASKRGTAPFIKVNCGAIPESLLESELFGSVKGAYTGAHADKPGMFRLAEGGTLYLTEIGDLPLQLQVKLLTVLDDREFYPLGSSRKVSVDVRIITGTHRNLKQLVKEGGFRQDLYYRLNVMRAYLPPLREREGDIPLLMDHFLQRTCRTVKKDIKGFTKPARNQLESYSYPGNIRELKNIIEYSVNICQTGRIDSNHLPSSIRSPERESPMAMEGAGQSAGEESGLAGQKEAAPAPASSWPEIEKKKILAALMQSNGNRTLAARELGWGRSTLWRKIRQYNLG